MKTNRPTSTEMVFILDRSGSMGGLEADTIGGFNGMIESQKAEPGAAVVTTVLFDDRTDVITNRVPLNQVAPPTSPARQPICTADPMRRLCWTPWNSSPPAAGAPHW